MSVHIIKEDHDLNDLASKLNSRKQFSIDLEFDRNRYRYGFDMCLMQIYDGDDCYIVDPLSDSLSISNIFPPIQNPEVQKVVFAFGEDLRLFHSLNCFPKNLFDLDIATSLLNYKPASLTNLISEVLGIEVNSSSQQSNWYKRPLTENQIQYAADDVIYLLDFKHALEEQARKQNLLDWILQENSIFDQLDYSEIDHNNPVKEKEKNNMTMYEWHIYCHLMDFFDGIAEKYNKPFYQIIKKEFVEELAKNPNKISSWQNTKGIFGKIKNSGFQRQLQQELHKSINEAESRNLSKTKKASYNLSKEEYLAMRRRQSHINNMKNKLMKPIQNSIAEDFGTHAKSFILPNRLAKEIIAGESELVPDYKIDLLKHYSEKLDIDLSEYV